MRRLEGSEIPETTLEFWRGENGRLVINIKGEHQNPVINYNDNSLTAARDVGSIHRPVFSAVSGYTGAGSSNSYGHAGAGGSLGNVGACGGSVESGSWGSMGHAGSGYRK